MAAGVMRGKEQTSVGRRHDGAGAAIRSRDRISPITRPSGDIRPILLAKFSGEPEVAIRRDSDTAQRRIRRLHRNSVTLPWRSMRASPFA